ncbi:MAG: nitroreductase family protein [Thermodesulfobacteriota bacterium]|nr:nitroreductase family protein [Thermodesulfobacteriota bacterium]
MFESLKQAYLPDTQYPERIVDPEKCTRCGRCYDTCPTAGYHWEKDTVPVPIGYGGFDQACINCGNCIAVCPADAITMEGIFNIKAGRYKGMLEGRMALPDPLSTGPEKEYADLKDELTPIEQTIFTRRSNRLFKNKTVSRETIHRLLEAGRFAPSAGNCQPYKFIVLTDQNLIHEFEKRSMRVLRLLKNNYLAKNGRRSKVKSVVFSIISYFMINKFDPRPMTAMEKADNRNNKMYFDAPVVLLILKDKRGISNPDLDAGICAQNIALAAHSLGLGTCYVSLPMEPLSMPIMAGFRKKIGIKSPYEAVTSLAIGYPKGKIDKPVKRDTPPVKWL